jgi:hypothetical protein
MTASIRALRVAARVGLALLLGAAVVLVFFVLPPAIATKSELPRAADRLKAQNDVRSAGIQLLGGLFIAAGLVFTARTIAVTREGQVTERFTRAVDQLGSEARDVRIGGIYALERVARDSERDHGVVVEILTAFLRERAPWPPRGEDSFRSLKTHSDEAPLPSAPADVQAALTVLGRRNLGPEGLSSLLWARERGLIRGRLNLARTDLRGADLSEAHLEEALLAYSCLAEAYMDGAHLEGAVLTGSDLAAASLHDAIYDRTTVWPDGYDPGPEGAKLVTRSFVVSLTAGPLQAEARRDR